MTQQVQPHILKRYEILKKLGSGAYGHVWKVIDRTTKQTLALKKIFDAFQHATDAQRTYREIVFLQKLRHENIIKLRNVIKADNDKDIYLVFEYMDIDLHNVIREGILKHKHQQYIVYQIAKAIKYMHSAELLHRDLKPSNVLLNSDCLVKLCDFGLVRSVATQNTSAHDEAVMTEYVATRWYRAPEILMGSKTYLKAVDIWSFGCLIAEMLKGKPLFNGTSTYDQFQKILSWTGLPTRQDVASLEAQLAWGMMDNFRGVRPRPVREHLPNTDELALDLISKMLQFNPRKRITIDQVITHPYLEEFHNSEAEVVSDRVIVPDIDDNTRLTLKTYRDLIYREIQKWRGVEKDLESEDVRCHLFPAAYRKTSHPKQRQEQSINNHNSPAKPLPAKTVLFEKRRLKPATPNRNQQSQLPYRMVPPEIYTSTELSSTVTKSKTQASGQLQKGRQKYLSMYCSKKGSISKNEDSGINFQPYSAEKKRKSISIYSNTKKAPALVTKYLSKTRNDF